MDENKTWSSTEGLASLKANVGRNNYDHSGVNPRLLEAAPAPLGNVPTAVDLDCPEFTSLCPATGQPDFGAFRIVYMPNDKIVESKSLKLYLGSFRNTGEFHEACAARIAQDLVDLTEPQWLVVRGIFKTRGGR